MKQQEVAFHPSQGLVGSIYETKDGITYVRTPWGTRKIEDGAIGQSLMMLQTRHEWYRQRYRASVVKIAGFFLAGLVVGLLTVLL